MGAVPEGEAWTPPATRELTAGRGRVLRYCCYGPADGLPVISLAGTPGTRWERPDVITAFEQAALRVAAPDRPGYGGSTRQPGRTVASVAADVQMIADAHGWPRFAVTGFSGGGPHALACAALLPARCLAAVSLAGLAPAHAGGLDWMAGMAPENVTELTAAAQGEPALTPFLEAAAAGVGQVTGQQVAEELGGLISAADRAVVTGEFADHMAGSFRIALRAGIAGWRDDDIAFVSDWGFPVEQASAVPVAIWQGDEDRMVPFSHGAWLAAHVPGARAHLVPGEGHLTIAVRSFGAVLDDLLDLAGRVSH